MVIGCRVTLKGPKLNVGSTLSTVEGCPVQNCSMSTSCWFVASTHMGSGAALTEQTKTDSDSAESLHICITCARISVDGLEGKSEWLLENLKFWTCLPEDCNLKQRPLLHLWYSQSLEEPFLVVWIPQTTWLNELYLALCDWIVSSCFWNFHVFADV